MSETIEEVVPPVETVTEPSVDTPDAPVETGTEETPTEQVEAKQPKWFKPAIDRLTREKNEARRERDLLKARLEILEAGRTDGVPAATQAEIDAAAARQIAARDANQARVDLISRGAKELGVVTWDEKTNIITTLGALEAPGFVEALYDIPEAPRLIAYLADEPDILTALLAKSPVKMAAEMGRIAGALPVAEPRPLSKVATPVRAVGPGRVAPPPDVTKMTPKEFIAYRDRTAPKHLGGKGHAA